MEETSINPSAELSSAPLPQGWITRRQALGYGAAAAAGVSGTLAAVWYLGRPATPPPASPAGPGPIADADSAVFAGDAPTGQLWELWQARGWAKEGYHYRKVGRNVQCKICPNHCRLKPGDRSHCRNRINKDGTLYTLAYSNPCALHVDPIEKKPLFHFLPASRSFSLATAGCVFRCLNCQNWDISQRKPEETKDPRGPELRLKPNAALNPQDIPRLSLFPEDVVARAQAASCQSIAYTYSEPIAFYEYTYDTCKAARAKKIKNVLVTCGYFMEESLADLAQYLDAAHVDLKGFDEDTYQKLNSGRLQPVLNTLLTLKRLGVWFEVINLVVPTYTDNLETIKRMCGWLVKNLGPDYPLHFSRFYPMHKLTYLSPTPVDVLLQARLAAMAEGLHYVYVGNVPGQPDVQNTICPTCKKAVVERNVFTVTGLHLKDGKCGFCDAKIAGVWSAT